MAYVYILQNTSNRFYIGSTNNLRQKIRHHMGGHTPSTKKLGKIMLVFSQECPTLAEARKIERWIKKMKRKDYIEKIIKDGYIKRTPV